MTPKTKKIIAREGLIIIGIIVVSVVLFIIGNIIPYEDPDQDTKYQYQFSTSKSSYTLNFERMFPIDSIADKWEAFQFFRKDFPEDYADLGIINNASFIPKDFKVEYLGIKNKNISNKAKILNNIRDIVFGLAIFVGLLTYPLYWLIRFIIWAVKTLKGK
jgi:hypothetical protein